MAAVASFRANCADQGPKPTTTTGRLSAIAWIHRQAGYMPLQRRNDAAPLLEVIAGIRRSRTAPVKKARADPLHLMLDAIPRDGLHATRDRAILAIGMAAALAPTTRHLVFLPERPVACPCPGSVGDKLLELGVLLSELSQVGRILAAVLLLSAKEGALGYPHPAAQPGHRRPKFRWLQDEGDLLLEW